MNLLRDKREDEKPVNAVPDGSLSEDQFQPAGENGARPSTVQPPKAKNSLSTLLIAASIFVIAILVTYFGFYKPKEGSRRAGANQTAAQVDSSGEQAIETASPDIKTTDTGVEQAAGSAIQSTGESSMATASSVLQTLQSSLGSGTVAAFFLDDGSFSAEVDAESPTGARDIYSSLQSALPAGSKLTSAEPTGSHALITGSVNASTATEPTGLAKTDIDTTLRQIAANAGATVSSLSVDAPASEQAFIVMRLSGSFAACQAFVAELSKKTWNISISKMILMPAPGGDFSLVLRFYM